MNDTNISYAYLISLEIIFQFTEQRRSVVLCDGEKTCF
jgi:hypothetical protein